MKNKFFRIRFPVGTARRRAVRCEEGNGAWRSAGRGQARWEAGESCWPSVAPLSPSACGRLPEWLLLSPRARESWAAAVSPAEHLTLPSWWRTEAPGPNVGNVPAPYVFCAMAGSPPCCGVGDNGDRAGDKLSEDGGAGPFSRGASARLHSSRSDLGCLVLVCSNVLVT